jgi:hypothetical protein
MFSTILGVASRAFSFAKDFTFPWWARIAIVLTLVAGYAAWNRYQQHEIDQVSYNKLDNELEHFRQQVADLGAAAKAQVERVELERKQQNEQLEKTHAEREQQLTTQAQAREARLRQRLATFEQQLRDAGASSGSGPVPAVPGGAGVIAQGVQCYDSAKLAAGIRAGAARFLGRSDEIFRRGEDSAAIVDLTCTWLDGQKVIDGIKLQ